ncbi:MAG: hypothetical protein ABIX00_07390 [Polaromonas sp.]
MLSERAGVGDLRLYGLVHFYPMLLISLLMWLFALRYTRGRDLLVVLAVYAAALVAEYLGREVFVAGGWISGHSVKHVLAAMATAWAVRMLRLRSPAPGALNAWQGWPACASRRRPDHLAMAAQLQPVMIVCRERPLERMPVLIWVWVIAAC